VCPKDIPLLDTFAFIRRYMVRSGVR
jgi:hypothetical protein